jgi:hypothetical protein
MVKLEQVEALARLQCTQAEAAAVLKLTPAQFSEMLRDRAPVRNAWELGREMGKVSIRRLQFRHAQMPNGAGVTMTKHLAAHHLGEFDPAVSINNFNQINVLGQLLAEIDGKTRSIPPEAQHQMVDVTPASPNALPDKNPLGVEQDISAELDALRAGLNGKKNGSGNGHT